MRIWVDADACPKAIKEILYRAADRRKIELILVANRTIHTPRSPHVRLLVVPRGFDVADKRIVEEMKPGDLVITGDIPLAAAVVEKGGLALGPSGEEFTEDNVQERLASGTSSITSAAPAWSSEAPKRSARATGRRSRARSIGS